MKPRVRRRPAVDVMPRIDHIKAAGSEWPDALLSEVRKQHRDCDLRLGLGCDAQGQYSIAVALGQVNLVSPAHDGMDLKGRGDRLHLKPRLPTQARGSEPKLVAVLVDLPWSGLWHDTSSVVR